MIVTTNYKLGRFQECADKLLELWSDKSNKVFVVKADLAPSNVKEYYFNNFKWLGKPFPLGESAKDGREKRVVEQFGSRFVMISQYQMLIGIPVKPSRYIQMVHIYLIIHLQLLWHV